MPVPHSSCSPHTGARKPRQKCFGFLALCRLLSSVRAPASCIRLCLGTAEMEDDPSCHFSRTSYVRSREHALEVVQVETVEQVRHGELQFDRMLALPLPFITGSYVEDGARLHASSHWIQILLDYRR